MFTKKLAASLIVTFLFACSTAYGQGRNYKSVWNYPSERAEIVVKHYPENRSTEIEYAKQIKKTILIFMREAYRTGRIDLMWSLPKDEFKKTDDVTKFLKSVEQNANSRYTEFDDLDKLIPVIDQLYADEANAGIPIVQMWKLAIDKLYGEDIEQKIKNIRGVITRVEQEIKK
jgi:hypothetical protein